METIRIFLVDDHELVRDGLKALLGGIREIEIIAEAATAGELFDKLKVHKPDIVILDISLPDMSGIDVTRKVSVNFPDIKVLVLSMYTGEDFILSAIKAGARGYLPKNTSRKELVDAIYAVNRDEDYFGESISKILLKSYIRNAKESWSGMDRPSYNLSPRETEILKLCAEGFGNRSISEKLGISIRTVETHKNHIMRKLGFKSTVEMVKFALKNKIIEL